MPKRSARIESREAQMAADVAGDVPVENIGNVATYGKEDNANPSKTSGPRVTRVKAGAVQKVKKPEPAKARTTRRAKQAKDEDKAAKGRSSSPEGKKSPVREVTHSGDNASASADAPNKSPPRGRGKKAKKAATEGAVDAE